MLTWWPRLSLSYKIHYCPVCKWQLGSSGRCRKAIGAGLDLWKEEEQLFYDSVVRVTEIQEKNHTTIGVEYLLPTPAHSSGRLHKAWEIEGAAPSPLKPGTCFKC